jgi:hypothetical protein
MSKGSVSRPFSVTAEEFSNRWNAIFNKGKSNVNNVQEETSRPDGTDKSSVSQEGRHDSSGDSPLPSDNKPSQ